MTNDLLAHCRYPDVAEPYLSALKEAVQFIVGEYDVLGIIAAGSIIRGMAHASSDWDIFVIQSAPQRQMQQRFFGGVPAQIFLNPPGMVRRYFASEAAEGVCITAHMLTTGFVVLDRDPLVETLREEARQVMARGPQVSPDALTMRRYHVASEFENAMDVIEAEPVTGLLILSHVLLQMLQVYFVRRQRFIPRNKDLLKGMREHNPALGRLVEDFYQAADLTQKINLARQIADQTIQAQGFFACETPLETVE